MPHDPYGALYIHIPFCVKRCGYCDFCTKAIAVDSPEIDDYIDDLCLQVRNQAKKGELASVKTIYIGGGTPSFVGPARLSKLLYMISVSLHLTDDVEYTMEANPDSLTEQLVKDIWALGVNRLSIGVQSFDDEILKRLGRAHDANRAIDAIKHATTRFDNVSIDLMCGIPGQTDEQFSQSLETAVSLGVKHVSVYPLTIEPHTQFDADVMSGVMDEPDEDVAASQMELAEKILGAHGFSRYEVASYALSGYESKHNTAYWTGVPYLGLGLSATTMTQNSDRRMRVQDGRVVDDLNAEQILAEDAMLGMRMTRGLSDEYVSKAAIVLKELIPTLEELCELGLVKHCDGAWKPTHRGWLCGNELYGRIFDLA